MDIISTNEYLSILDMEISKADMHFNSINKDFVIKVCTKTLNILKESPNLLILTDTKTQKVIYIYRHKHIVILDTNLDFDADSDYIFEEIAKVG